MIPLSTTAREAFDRHAETYDQRFSHRPLTENIRAKVWRVADLAFRNSQRILDLGCGTGEDAIHFAQKGIHVTAIDVSSAMVARLEAKRAALNLENRLECFTSEMNRYVPTGTTYDGIFSNFGALNCVADLRWLETLAQSALQPGAHLVLTTMGVFYPFETLLFLMKGQPRRAVRRWSSPSTATVEGMPIDVYYHSIRSMRQMLGPSLRLERIMGLCSLSPAPGWDHLQGSIFVRALAPLDACLCRARWTAEFADHVITVWRYQPVRSHLLDGARTP